MNLAALAGLDQDDLGYQSRNIGDMEPISRLAAKAFFSLGLKPKSVVHICLPNNTEFYFPCFATWLCQGIVSVADPTLRAGVLASQLGEAQPDIVVCYEGNKDTVIKALDEANLRDKVTIILMGLKNVREEPEKKIFAFENLVNKASDLPELPEKYKLPLDIGDTATILWSSGTTGRPKGIPNPYRSALKYLDTKFAMPGNMLQTTCFFHGGGFITPISAMIQPQNASYFFPVGSLENNTDKLFRAVDKFKTFYFIGGAHHITRLAAANRAPEGLDLTSLMGACPMGSNIPYDTHDKLKKHFPNLETLMNFYGMTEFGNLISFSETPRHLGFIGPGTTVKIVNPENGDLCDFNEVGEILAKCDSIMSGYINRYF